MEKKTLILNRSTEEEIASCKNKETAMVMAINKGFENSEMKFVNGKNDIDVYKLALRIFDSSKWLPGYLASRHAQDHFIFSATERLELWSRIKNSRIVLRWNEYALPLAEIIGAELAADVELLIFLDQQPFGQLYYPLINKSIWSACRTRSVLAKWRFREKGMLAMRHDTLGVALVTPEALVAGNDRFNKIIREKNKSTRQE